MTEVVSVKFKNGGKEYFFDPDGNNVKTGDIIIVEMQRGKEMATAILPELQGDAFGITHDSSTASLIRYIKRLRK